MASEDWLFVAEAPLFSDFEEWIDEGNSTLTLSLRCREKEKELLSVFCQVFFGIDLKLLTVLTNIKPAVTSCTGYARYHLTLELNNVWSK